MAHDRHEMRREPPRRREPDPDDEPPRERSRESYRERRERRDDRAHSIANVITVVTGLVATIFVLHIVFTLFGANESSGVVSFVYGVAKVLVLGFGDVFTPDDATLGLVLNYGLAAIVYLVIGRLITRALRRR